MCIYAYLGCKLYNVQILKTIYGVKNHPSMFWRDRQKFNAQKFHFYNLCTTYNVSFYFGRNRAILGTHWGRSLILSAITYLSLPHLWQVREGQGRANQLLKKGLFCFALGSVRVNFKQKNINGHELWNVLNIEPVKFNTIMYHAKQDVIEPF